MNKKEKLILEIIKEAEADGEPVSREEAEEMAEMELKAKGIKNYVQSTVEKPKTKRTVKKDEEKIKIIEKIFNFLLTNGFDDVTIVNEQREITFRDYSLTLTKHRKKAR